MILLTQVDEMCKYVKWDKRMVFRSPKVKKLVSITQRITGLTEPDILPFVSYATEHACVNPAIDLLALRSMLALLHFASNVITTQEPQDDMNIGNDDKGAMGPD